MSDGTCNRGGEDLPCTCYQGPDFQQMTRDELERAAERWRQRAIAAESPTRCEGDRHVEPHVGCILR